MILPDSDEARARAAGVIRSGGIVAFRTDTFYGLGADPFNRDAVRRLNELKGRDDKPILVVIGDYSQAARFIETEPGVFEIVSGRHWPGALTIVIKARAEVPEELTAGTGTIGLRLPGDEAVRSFVSACGGALTATSANLAGSPPARTAEEVERAFPRGIDLIVDDGPAIADKPSTVLDLSGPQPRVIREGVVPISDLDAALGTTE
ncbi:MAG: L-threonylcarbamoyladenylate synthase [Acidobacteriota bacterium]|jgi:L-threonylcarbamoyladenylate synthase|nr:L-threonylcarbamoyladenylate synthase [Acidobacteriota bacterium]